MSWVFYFPQLVIMFMPADRQLAISDKLNSRHLPAQTPLDLTSQLQLGSASVQLVALSAVTLGVLFKTRWEGTSYGEEYKDCTLWLC